MTDSHPAYPRLFPGPEQTIAGIGRALREGRGTCVDILDRCLGQVDEWEAKVHAWVVLDRDRAIRRARALDEELKGGKDRGPLHGIPIGIKDIIDVKGLPTACGARRWADRVAEEDAEVVARLRKAGAVIMGKTVTTPYAWIDPPITRNPWNLDRTPGGSSSGSAAAVACGMCFGAIGTQTGGSITRPASFCGVAGMKPVSWHVDSKGVRPFAASLDHVGPIARSVADLGLLFDAIFIGGSPERRRRLAGVDQSGPPYRLGRLHGFFDRRVEPSIRSLLEESTRALVCQGAEVVAADDPIDFDQVIKDHRTVMSAEAAEVHSEWLDEFPDDYPPHIRELILEGQPLPALAYIRARNGRDFARESLQDLRQRLEAGVLITPATVTTAPDPSTTGDPAFNSPWSYTRLPTVSVPIGLAPDDLPVAVQLIGLWLDEYKLLNTAAWCEQVIRTWRQQEGLTH
jgi:aspartyl-tRNA(Asn)/glutamyl-tRNA(Gln) amidotransferase subunit A